MSEPFTGEIRWFGFVYPTLGWLPCDGRLVRIAQFPDLYTILGTTYGGNGLDTFGLPDLRGRVAVGVDPRASVPSMTLGARIGAADVTLDISAMPAHTHAMVRHGGSKAYVEKLNTPSSQSCPAALALEDGSVLPALSHTGTPDRSLHPSAITVAGGDESHSNMQPHQILTACICVDGTRPSPP